jgi:hypothetical protein
MAGRILKLRQVSSSGRLRGIDICLIVLISDVFPAHRDLEVKDLAKS